MRQFEVGGPVIRINGLMFRVLRGEKPDRLGSYGGDQLIEVKTPQGWKPVEMRMVGMLHAFFCENEDHLYPPPRWLGRDYWHAWLELCEEDWQAADKKLAREKAWADRRRRAA